MRACLWAWRCRSLLKNLMVTSGGVSTEWALLIGQRCEVRDLIRMLPTYPFTAITPPCSSSEDIVGEKTCSGDCQGRAKVEQRKVKEYVFVCSSESAGSCMTKSRMRE